MKIQAITQLYAVGLDTPVPGYSSRPASGPWHVGISCEYALRLFSRADKEKAVAMLHGSSVCGLKKACSVCVWARIEVCCSLQPVVAQCHISIGVTHCYLVTLWMDHVAHHLSVTAYNSLSTQHHTRPCMVDLYTMSPIDVVAFDERQALSTTTMHCTHVRLLK